VFPRDSMLKAATVTYRALVMGARGLLLLTLSCCQQPPEILQPLLQPGGGLQAAPPRVSGSVPTDRASQRVFEAPGIPSQQTAGTITQPAAAPGQAGDVTLNFVDTDIREVARTILGTTLKLNYTIDPAVHGTATLYTGTPLARSALLPTLETLLNQSGATLVEKNGLYEVVPVAVAGFVPYLVFAANPDVRLAIPLLVAAGACALYGLGLDARVRDATPVPLFARTMSVSSAGLMALQGAGFTLAGALAQALGPATAIAVSGGCGLATVFLLAGPGFRTRRIANSTHDTEEAACLEPASSRGE